MTPKIELDCSHSALETGSACKGCISAFQSSDLSQILKRRSLRHRGELVTLKIAARSSSLLTIQTSEALRTDRVWLTLVLDAMRQRVMDAAELSEARVDD
jgi:hypothetical protein